MEAVTVIFDELVPADAQGVALLAFEKHLRALTGQDVRVFKQKMGDDLKRRREMTIVQRDNL
jgi:hypothetical protein